MAKLLKRGYNSNYTYTMYMTSRKYHNTQSLSSLICKMEKAIVSVSFLDKRVKCSDTE